MTLVYPLLNEPIRFEENRINVLVLENPHELRRLLNCFRQQEGGADGELVLSENAEPVDMSKALMLITDIFSLDFGSRKLLGKINQEACLLANNCSEEFYALMAQINQLALRIGSSLGFDAAFEPMESPEELIKLMAFHVDAESLSFPEQILEYISLNCTYLKKSLFVVYNLKACLSEEELLLFYKSALYRKLNILLVEDCRRSVLKEYENVRIIDKDLCVI